MPKNTFQEGAPSQASDATLETHFTAQEVSPKHWKMTNLSPGSEAIAYRDPNAEGRGCHVLTMLYNACKSLESVPQNYKKSLTMLVHKKGDRDDTTNWKPLMIPSQ